MIKKAYSYIRFSSTEQQKGDSLRRQLEATELYAKENGLILDTSLRMHDLGKSAYHGDHIAKGALGLFLELAQKGKVEKGSVLIVESLDRFTREKVTTSLPRFLDIINAGIKIVTLIDRQEFDEESINSNPYQIQISIGSLIRAYDESRTKSIRLKKAWAEKRKKAHKGKKISKRCPQWLELSKDRQEYIELPDRVKIVKRIFEMYLAGQKPNMILRKFNSEKIPVFGCSKKGWYRSSVHKILTNRAVIGEWQGNKMNPETRKFEPEGEPVPDYYPRIIDDSTFYKVQNILSQNPPYGRLGKVQNLFSHRIECGLCGTSMRIGRKGRPNKPTVTMVCNLAARGGNCQYRSLRYDMFEEVFLETCVGLNLSDILNNNQGEKEHKLSVFQDKLLVNKSKRAEITNKIDNWTEQLGEVSVKLRVLLQGKIDNALNELEGLTKAEKTLSKEIYTLKNTNSNAKENLKLTQKAISQLRSSDDENRIDLRLKVREKIRSLIKMVKVYPEGSAKIRAPKALAMLQKNLNDLTQQKTLSEDETEQKKITEQMITHFHNIIDNSTKKDCEYLVEFNAGGVMIFAYNLEGKLEKRIETDPQFKAVSGTLCDFWK